MLPKLDRIALIALILLASPIACDQKTATPTRPKVSGPNVLLITLDTVRADRLGCYGYEAAKTPAIDQLAANGTLFQSAFCQVPLTLPSHVSLMTGTFPRSNGVRINGATKLGAGIPTLAEEFKQAGYATAAFVSAAVLDAAYGLDRGFDVYDDSLGTVAEGGGETLERRGDRTTDAAIAWLGRPENDGFFAWIHLFDPHHPYEPPDPYKSTIENPYDGEIAFTDAQVARIMQVLREKDLQDKTLVVVAGDHGEAFAEHGEYRHGIFLYDTTLQVPLIFWLPGAVASAKTVAGNVGLVDVFPSILDVAGLTVPENVEGRSFAAALAGEALPMRAVYAETQYPKLAYGWSSLRAWVAQDWKYVDAPSPELYNRETDPAESANVVADSIDVADAMKSELRLFAAQTTLLAEPESVTDSALSSQLEALGYVGSTGEAGAEDEHPSGRDPKDMIKLAVAHQMAMGLVHEGKFDEVIRMMEPVVKESPESDQFFEPLARAYLQTGQFAKAEQAFRATLRRVPSNSYRLWGLGEALRMQGKTDDARAHFEAALTARPDLAEAYCSLGDLARQTRRPDEALDFYRRAITVNPLFGPAHSRLGLYYAERRKYEEAEKHFREHLLLEPDSPNALTNLANVLPRVGKQREAVELLLKALRIDPAYAPAHRFLWQIYWSNGDTDQAITALRMGCRDAPHETSLRRQLARQLISLPQPTSEQAQEALQLAVQTCRENAHDAENVQVLAMAQAATGEFDKAIATANQAAMIASKQRNAGLAQTIQRQIDLYRQHRYR